MFDLDRARMAGVGGTLLSFFAPFLLGILFILAGAVGFFEVEVPLSSAISWVLIGYAVWKLSGISNDPRIFTLYLAYVAFGAAGDAVFLWGNLVPSQTGTLAYLLGENVTRVAAGVFLYLSFARIASKLGYDLFLWAGRFVLIAAVAEVTTYFDTPFSLFVLGLSLVAFVLEVLSFNSLRVKAPTPGTTMS